MFSRNPDSGLLESYEDDGVYAGHVFTLGDLIGSKDQKKSAGDEFRDEEHPRDENGRFTKGSGEMKESGESFEELKPVTDPEFDIFSWFDEEESEEEKAAREEKKKHEEREAKERERYGNNGLSESEYPEELRLTDKERDTIAGVFRAYKDDSFKSDASRDVIDALSGLLDEERIDQKEKKLREMIEESTNEISRKKAEGYSYKTHNPQSAQTKKQKLAQWWNEVYENGVPSNWGANGIRYWQLLRAGAIRDMGQLDLARKITKRDEFARKQPNYMPWRKNPNRDNPRYRPWVNDSAAMDGGPGSGNFGHRGRPGKVGGSGKGGGAQYRGGRSDIGYYGSRQDWLNGLSGETQHEAILYLGDIKKKMEHKKKAKEKFDKLRKDGLLTETEYNEAIKKANLDKFNEQDTPEEFLMKNGDAVETRKLLILAKEARNWDKYKERLLDDNLTEEEKKLYNAIVEKYDDWDQIYGTFERWQGLLTQEQFEAKALGIFKGEIDVPDEIQYRLGVKERPKPKGADYSWVKSDASGASRAGYYLGASIGGVYSYMHNYTPEEFKELHQKFVDKFAYDIVSPNQAAYYGVRTVVELRKALSEVHPQHSFMKQDYKYGKEQFDRLSDEEKKKLLNIVNTVNNNGFLYEDVKNVEDLTLDDFIKAENKMHMSTPRKKDERRMIQDYVLLQHKMITGITPTPKDEVERKKQEEEEERKNAEREAGEAERKKREELLKTPKAKAEMEEAKKVRKAREEGKKTRRAAGEFASSVGKDYYEEASVKMDECGDIDAQVAWDLYHGDVSVQAGTESFFRPFTGQIHLALTRVKNGDDIHAPFETLFHEFTHSMDVNAAEKLGYTSSPYSDYPHLSSVWNNGEFCDAIEEEGKAYIERLAKKLKAEFESVPPDKRDSKFFSRYYDRGSSEWWDAQSGKKQVKWTPKVKEQAIKSWLYDQDHLQYANMCDMIQGVTRSKIRAFCGHRISYFQGKDARENMASEMFAELFGATITNPKSLELFKKEMPKTYDCFRRMLKEITERG